MDDSHIMFYNGHWVFFENICRDDLYIQNDVFVSNSNGQNNTVMTESKPDTLIIGKGRHAYIRSNFSNMDSDNVEKIVLNFNKKYIVCI